MGIHLKYFGNIVRVYKGIKKNGIKITAQVRD